MKNQVRTVIECFYLQGWLEDFLGTRKLIYWGVKIKTQLFARIITLQHFNFNAELMDLLFMGLSVSSRSQSAEPV